jgi:predicted AlkP superfamily pyrophosphatase or phosphodiesterase
MAKKKSFWKVILTVVVCAGVVVGGFFGGLRILRPIFDKRFIATINAAPAGTFNNSLGNRTPQTELYDVMVKHLTEERADGKTPKLLFIGYDGCIAAGIAVRAEEQTSAVNRLAKEGGLWLGQAGGAVVGDQQTRTAPGWGSMFTGVWASEHGIFSNKDTLNGNVHSIFYAMDALGKKVSFNFSWKPHLTVTYANEAAQRPALFNLHNNDRATTAAMLAEIGRGDDGVFGTLEYTDHAGHSTGYSIHNKTYMRALANAEKDANLLIDAAEQRQAEHPDEDWLIIITTDHGGYALNHKGATAMESTTFFASNRSIFSF